MSGVRMIVWATFGAFTGALFAFFVSSQIGHAYAEGGVYFPVPQHLVMCWPILLVLFPWNGSHAVFLGAIYVLNACTYAFLFLIVGMIHQSFSRSATDTAGGSL